MSLVTCSVLVAVALPVMGGWTAEAVPPRVLRLHVIAHSDDPADQALKLRVRDAVLPLLADAVAGAAGPDEAMERVEARRAVIEGRARQVIRAAGYPYGVRVETGRFPFPARRSGDTVYPAGTYDAVRVVIGDGRGRNFWCVLFPGLCVLTGDNGPAGNAPDRAVAAAEASAPVGGAGDEPAGESAGGETGAPGGGEGAPEPASDAKALTLVDEAATGVVRPQPRLLLLSWWEAGVARWRAAVLAVRAAASR